VSTFYTKVENVDTTPYARLCTRPLMHAIFFGR